MSVTVDLQIASTHATLPSLQQCQQWLKAATATLTQPCEVTIRFVDEPEMTALNHQYRGQDKSTNVLSFPYERLEGVDDYTLGDIIICAPVIAREALVQHKSEMAHFAHMVIHGALHLQGYDHETAVEAECMESLEIELLKNLAIDNPYKEDKSV